MKKVFGLVGPIASGKGTVAKYLESQGFKHYSLSDRIREEITSRGKEITRESLYETANELRENLGENILAKKTVEVIEKENPENVVIDSIRNPEEINYLKEKFGAKIIGITAPQEKRYEMFKARGNNSAGVNSWEEFKELDDKELVQTGDHKQQVGKSLDMANVVIENDGTVDELNEKIKLLLG